MFQIIQKMQVKIDHFPNLKSPSFFPTICIILWQLIFIISILTWLILLLSFKGCKKVTLPFHFRTICISNNKVPPKFFAHLNLPKTEKSLGQNKGTTTILHGPLGTAQICSILADICVYSYIEAKLGLFPSRLRRTLLMRQLGLFLDNL